MRLDVPLSVDSLAPHEEPITPSLSECISDCFGVFVETIADGEFHRFATDPRKPNSLDGFYILHDEGKLIYGSYGSWRENVSRPYTNKQILTTEQHIWIQERRKADEIRIQEERKKVAHSARAEWESLPVAKSHPYLDKKGINNKGDIARVNDNGELVLPVYKYAEDGSYYISSLQYIKGNGEKKFKSGGETKGGFMGIPGSGRTFLCEGFATGVSIADATGAEVIIAFNCGNLPRVAELFKASKPTIVADNDESHAGEDAAKKSGCPYVLIPEAGMDANDYAEAHGTQQLKELLLGVEPKPWLVNLKEQLAQPQPIKWLIKDWIPEGSLAMIHGAPASGKSFVALDMMLTLASGLGSWQSNKAKPANVLYLCGEGYHGIPARVQAWLQEHEGAEIGNFYISSWALSLDNKQEQIFVKNAIRSLPFVPDFIPIDTLNKFFSGDENSAQDIRAFLEFLDELIEEFGCTVLLIHHTGVAESAQGRARGSSALRGAVDVEISVTNEEKLLTLTQKKQKDAELQSPMTMFLKSVVIPGWYDEEGEEVSSAVAINASQEKREDDGTLEDMTILIESWVTGRQILLEDKTIFIPRADIRRYLYETWGINDAPKEEANQLINKAKAWLREDHRYKGGIKGLLEKGLISQIQYKGKEGYRINDSMYVMAAKEEAEIRRKNGN